MLITGILEGVKQANRTVQEFVRKTEDYLNMGSNIYDITMKPGLSETDVYETFITYRNSKLKSNLGLYYPTNSGEFTNESYYSTSQSNSAYMLPIDDIQHGFTNDVIQLLTKYDFTYHLSYNTFAFERNEKYNEEKNSKDGNKGLQQRYIATYTVPSIFNPYFSIKSTGFMSNLPLADIDLPTTPSKNNKDFVDYSDCSIKTLLNISNSDNGGILGRAIYTIADFMYCKDLGKVSNNHLLTLRRFGSPVGDHINRLATISGGQYESLPDIGRLVTWFGTEDNKLSDILKMSFNASWKQMESKIQEQETDGAGSGILGMVANTLNGDHNEAQAAGITNTNNLTSMFLGKISANLSKSGDYVNHTVLKNYDEHKIYEPKNTIRSNHYYEGNLIFNHEFTLKFCYKLRSYGITNQKSAMLDLIHNILHVTYMKGKFWGGSVKFYGPPGNDSFMNKANAFIDNTWDKLGGIFHGMLTGNIDWQGVMGSLSDAASAAADVISGARDVASGKSAQKFGNAISQFIKDNKFGDAFKGQLKNALGRPALYALNSLVHGEETGLWHLTVGNPLNPIATIGNLIITNTELSFGDSPLGLDDFPTEINVSITLKHALPRDLTGIGKLFTRGEFGLAISNEQSDEGVNFYGKEGKGRARNVYADTGTIKLNVWGNTGGTREEVHKNRIGGL